MRAKPLVAGALAILVAVAIAAGGWWVSGRFAQRVALASGVADQVAAALQAGQVPAVAVAGAAAPPAELDAVLEGMGTIPHTVWVASLGLTDGGDALDVGLRHSWRVQPDKAPWVYETTGRLRWDGRAWALAWDPAMLAPGLTEDQRLRALRLAPTRGAIVGSDGATFAPDQAPARPLLGVVGAATQAQVDASGGRVRLGDTVGLTGLQAAQDERLAGTPGYVVQAVGPGDATRDLTRVAPVAGEPLAVSLSARVQRAAEQTLARVGPPAAIVAIRPSDAAVLAAASGPGSQGYSTATLGQYAPGSTFKVVTSEALLAGGLTPDSTVECTPTATVDGRGFTNYSDYPASALGRVALRVAIAQSCNTAMINARDIAAPSALTAAAEVLGLTGDPELGVPAYLGSVPTGVGATEHAAGLIGQGQVLASPLGMATVAASVAAGRTVAPIVVLDGVLDGAGGDGASSAASPVASSGAWSGATAGPGAPAEVPHADELRELMRGVVTDGSASFLADVPGAPVLAKTGTAEYGTDTPPRAHAWMIAVHGDLAVSVFVEDGVSGSKTAGPLLETFLRAAS